MAHTLTMKPGFFSAQREAARSQPEQEAYEALIGSCWEALWRYAYRTTGNKDDAEDLLSETLVEGFKSFSQFRGETTFLRWMYRVMTTTRIDMARWAARRHATSLEMLMGDSENDLSTRDIPDRASDPEAIIVGPMLSETVQNALNALPEEYRLVVILADLEQMDYVEVSRVLQIPIGTVRSRLHRSRQLLRKALAPYVEGETN
jgi:RNA polymerase sigma-70 factor (ECF subfamily)